MVSFKYIDDEEIDFVENFIRTEVFRNLTTEVDKSIGSDCDAIVDNDVMVQHFGNRYASDPTKFKFERGDRIFIKELVAYVKKEAVGPGLQRFRMKRKRDRKPKQIETKNRATDCVDANEQSTIDFVASTEIKHPSTEYQSLLKSKLLKKVKECLTSFKIDADSFGEQMIHLYIGGDKIYGGVQCIECENSGIDTKPKRVYYNDSPDSRYWVISNFTSHLIKKHKLVALKTVVKSKKKVATNHKNKMKHENTDNNGTAEKSFRNDVKPVHSDVEAHMEHADDDIILVFDGDINNNNDPTQRLLDQMTSQINKMVAATLNNADNYDPMDILIGEEVRHVSVAHTDGDGNCLPSALAHQLFKHPIGSEAHIAKTAALRSSVVDHILQPKNFSRYRMSVEEHMKDINITVSCQNECENFVRNNLSRSGQWMGLETLKAVSDIYAVTIIVFNEGAQCYAIRGQAPDYDRSIVIAYRMTLDQNDTFVYNHYDSVVDVDACTLHDSANIITKRYHSV